jgi:hypothetical protein
MKRWRFLLGVSLVMAVAVAIAALWMTPRAPTYQEIYRRAFQMTPKEFEAAGAKLSGVKRNEWIWKDNNGAVIVSFDDAGKALSPVAYYEFPSSLLARVRRWLGL